MNVHSCVCVLSTARIEYIPDTRPVSFPPRRAWQCGVLPVSHKKHGYFRRSSPERRITRAEPEYTRSYARRNTAAVHRDAVESRRRADSWDSPDGARATALRRTPAATLGGGGGAQSN